MLPFCWSQDKLKFARMSFPKSWNSQTMLPFQKSWRNRILKIVFVLSFPESWSNATIMSFPESWNNMLIVNNKAFPRSWTILSTKSSTWISKLKSRPSAGWDWAWRGLITCCYANHRLLASSQNMSNQMIERLDGVAVIDQSNWSVNWMIIQTLHSFSVLQ